MNRKKTGQIIAYVSIAILWVFGILVFIFALLSGSEDYGGGFMGIINNSPNALPWVLLLALIFVAGKRKLIGGILICLLGIGSMAFFQMNAKIFQWPAFIISAIPVILGGMLLFSWYLMRPLQNILKTE